MTQLPHVLKRIRLNLASRRNSRSARTSTVTSSSRRSIATGISIRSSGTNTASIAACAGSGKAKTEIGHLVHKPGGAEHGRWVFDYDGTAEADDEAGYRFGDHAFRPGEYVSIRGEDGNMHAFQVVSVEPAT